MSSNTDDLGNPKVDLPDGAALFALPHDPNKAAESIQRDIGQKTDSAPTETPDPTASDDEVLDPTEDGGPLRRFTDIKSPLGMVGLESLAKDEDEIAKAISARSDEIYRNEFPVITPKWECRCQDCEAEFDDDVDACPECGCEDFATPDAGERRELRELFDSINKEGQSMRQVGKITDEDHSRLGVLTWVLRWQYLTGPRDVDAAGAAGQQILTRKFDELVRGDAKRIRPVVDENGRLGNVWWTCPLHRNEAVVNATQYDGGQTRCPECGCDLREVHYVELGQAAGNRVEKYFFEHEIVMHAGHIPQAHGLDGLSPVHLVWLEQAILHWMDVYAAEFFNPHSERTPNKFLIVHTSNPDHFEKQLDQAKDEAQQNPYKSGIFYNQIAPDQSANTEAQVIDVMGEELLGQSEDLRKRYENHIRTVFGVTDVFDSELEDAGGLNNEGLQLEVTDRSIAAAQQDYSDGPYDELLRYLGYEDWRVGFVPPREQDLEEQRQAVRLLREAAGIGLPARMENGQPVIGDGEAEAPAQAAPDAPDDEDPLQGDPDDMSVPPPDDESGNASADDAVEALRDLTEAQKHLTWTEPDGAVGQKAAEPFWDRDEDVPEFVREAIEEALRSGAIREISDDLPAGITRRDVESFFEDKLTQPQGWSIRSLAEDYADRFGVGVDEAVQNVRRQTKSVLDKGRELGYERQTEDAEDEPVFKWVGPIDDDKTDASWEVLEQTNPDHGGTPRPLPELKQIVADARDRHFPDLDAEWADSWQDRDTFVEHFE
jgi:hypothetical protein